MYARLPVSDSNNQYVENGHLTLITQIQSQQWDLVNYPIGYYLWLIITQG